MNGNDMIEHIEKCDSCILIQDRLDNEIFSEDEEKKLLEKQNDCFDNSFNDSPEDIK